MPSSPEQRHDRERRAATAKLLRAAGRTHAEIRERLSISKATLSRYLNDEYHARTLARKRK